MNEQHKDMNTYFIIEWSETDANFPTSKTQINPTAISENITRNSD